ncbi:MAG: GTPase domain-containing protein [Nostoc sp. NMS1]|uniref:GTPase n=1 Tax=unclassified Nostoc TaxID=2593658 RepID=UPI0025F87718|nr:MULTISPECIES: GTPase domain-containing protein [unclassified Nostoc]MBN3905198.1 GTPase domain-containing protein [Nostoc sp. NMS1]MBN3992693.1 GTPase domain-containing protein [Nostoc sp. NMS2]
MAEETVTKAVASIMGDIKSPNILVMGAIGAGKSSLINAVFGKEPAKVGAGLPVTKSFNYYSNSIVNIYDSAGYQLSEGKTFVENIIEFLQTKEKLGIEEQIHLVWYLINAASARVEFFEINIINQLRKRKIPLIIVISQCDRASAEEIKSVKNILADFGITPESDLIEIAASPLIFKGKPISETFGLEELVAKSIEHLPAIYADAVRMAQIVNLKSKRELAWKLIVTAATASFGSAWIPIPGATTGTTLAVQASLSISIASIYGFGKAREFLSRIYQGTPTESALRFAGTTLGLDILRSLIPIVGSLVAAGTSATYIVVLGLAYTSAFEAMAKAHIDPNDTATINSFLTTVLKQEFEKYTDIAIKTKEDLANFKNIFINK